jgi:hypothetical protein
MMAGTRGVGTSSAGTIVLPVRSRRAIIPFGPRNEFGRNPDNAGDDDRHDHCEKNPGRVESPSLFLVLDPVTEPVGHHFFLLDRGDPGGC